MPLAPRSGPVASLHLGSMNFGRRTPRKESLALLGAALDARIPLIDTANVYNDGESERIVGEATRGRDVLVATKVGLASVDGRPEGLGRAAILRACEASLARLGRPIDLYYLHAPDPETEPAETLDALATLLERGHIRAWGVSNFASWQILEFRTRAAASGLPAPAAAQQLYNVLIRQLDIEYFRYAARHPLHTTVYNPLAGGLLAGHHGDTPAKGSRLDKNPMYRRRYWHEAMLGAVDQLREIARDAELTLRQLAYAHVLRHPGVDAVLIGPATRAHLEDALAALPLTLDPEIQARVDRVYVELVGTDARYAR